MAFSLDGTLTSLPRGAADPAGQFPRPAGPAGGAPATGTAAPPTAKARPEDLDKGKEIYTTTCVVCHGPNGQGGTHGGAKLTSALTREAITSVVAAGRHDMPAFGSALSPEQLRNLSDYVLSMVAAQRVD